MSHYKENPVDHRSANRENIYYREELHDYEGQEVKKKELESISELVDQTTDYCRRNIVHGHRNRDKLWNSRLPPNELKAELRTLHLDTGLTQLQLGILLSQADVLKGFLIQCSNSHTKIDYNSILEFMRDALNSALSDFDYWDLNKNDRENLSRQVCKVYRAKTTGNGDLKRLFCHLTGKHYPLDNVCVYQFVPGDLSLDAITHIFGSEVTSLNGPHNSITVHKSLADGINKGQISIVPDKEKIKRGDWEWVTLLTDSESTANKKISGNLSWADVHNRPLIFRGSSRPGRRFVFFRYMMTYFYLKNTGTRSRWVDGVDMGELVFTQWVEPYEWFRRSMLRSLGCIIANVTILPKAFEYMTFKDMDNEDKCKMDRLNVGLGIWILDLINAYEYGSGTEQLITKAVKEWANQVNQRSIERKRCEENNDRNHLGVDYARHNGRDFDEVHVAATRGKGTLYDDDRLRARGLRNKSVSFEETDDRDSMHPEMDYPGEIATPASRPTGRNFDGEAVRTATRMHTRSAHHGSTGDRGRVGRGRDKEDFHEEDSHKKEKDYDFCASDSDVEDIRDEETFDFCE